MIWNETIECMNREEMRRLQSIRLRRVVEHAYHNSPFYRKKMQEMGITPEDIHSIDDIVKLPFTVKQDLRDNYPFGLMAVPMSEIVRLHASSGTTGKPIVVGYTRKDLSIWAEVVARCLTAYGLTKNDSVQVSYGYGFFPLFWMVFEIFRPNSRRFFHHFRTRTFAIILSSTFFRNI